MPTIDVNFEFWPKQAEAFQTEATELLLGGATRGGKSHFIRVASSAWCLAIPKLQVTLIRKKYQDILENHVYGHNGYKDILRPLIEAGEVKVTQDAVTFNNGSRIVFKHCQDERQFETAQGVASNVLIIDEATQISERLIKTFRAWCTMTEEMKASLPEQFKGKFPRIIYTANPIGPSLPYFRRKFVKARPQGAIEYIEGFKRQFIPAYVRDNPSEDPVATKGRVEGMHGKALAKALLEGDWDVPLSDFFDCWDEERHVVPDFLPPPWWYRWRALDWGSADPTAVYWFACSDGEMFDADCWTYQDGMMQKIKRTLWFPRGAKIVYREWYICQEDDPSKGLKMRNADIALGVLERSPDMPRTGIITLTDSYVFPDRGEEGGQTIAKTFADNGVPLTLGDTSRVTGWAAMRDALIGKEFEEGVRYPMLYIQEGCKYARDYIPALPRHENEAKKHEDAAEHGEATHACDAIRLGNMALAPAKDAPVDSEEYRRRYMAEMNLKLAEARKPPTFEDAVKMVQKQKARGSGKRF